MRQTEKSKPGFIYADYELRYEVISDLHVYISSRSNLNNANNELVKLFDGRGDIGLILDQYNVQQYDTKDLIELFEDVRVELI